MARCFESGIFKVEYKSVYVKTITPFTGLVLAWNLHPK